MDPVGAGTNAIFIQGDFTSPQVQQAILHCKGNGAVAGAEAGVEGHRSGCLSEDKGKRRQPNVILSDMLMNTSGTKADHHRSMELAYSVLYFANEFLAPGGNLVCKILKGEDDKELLAAFKETFKTAKFAKPEASRAESSEIYIVGLSKSKTSDAI